MKYVLIERVWVACLVVLLVRCALLGLTIMLTVVGENGTTNMLKLIISCLTWIGVIFVHSRYKSESIALFFSTHFNNR